MYHQGIYKLVIHYPFLWWRKVCKNDYTDLKLVLQHSPSFYELVQYLDALLHVKIEQKYILHDGGPYHIETSPLLCRANQWTGFSMIGTSVMKELIQLLKWLVMKLAIMVLLILIIFVYRSSWRAMSIITPEALLRRIQNPVKQKKME